MYVYYLLLRLILRSNSQHSCPTLQPVFPRLLFPLQRISASEDFTHVRGGGHSLGLLWITVNEIQFEINVIPNGITE
jgi:hypothetical protein